MKLCIKIFMIALIFTGCDKDEPTCQGIDCLPPATQTGAGTFGCLVNGVPYVDNSGRFNCFYQLVNGKYYFSISANFNNEIKGIGLGSQEIELVKSSSYPLIEIKPNNFSADIYFDANNNFETSSTSPGNIVITNFSTVNNIISANFEFIITNLTTGAIYKITQGRFDAKFTQ